eukprot:gene12241-biopygen7924
MDYPTQTRRVALALPSCVTAPPSAGGAKERMHGRGGDADSDYKERQCNALTGHMDNESIRWIREIHGRRSAGASEGHQGTPHPDGHVPLGEHGTCGGEHRGGVPHIHGSETACFVIQDQAHRMGSPCHPGLVHFVALKPWVWYGLLWVATPLKGGGCAVRRRPPKGQFPFPFSFGDIGLRSSGRVSTKGIWHAGNPFSGLFETPCQRYAAGALLRSVLVRRRPHPSSLANGKSRRLTHGRPTSVLNIKLSTRKETLQRGVGQPTQPPSLQPNLGRETGA